MNFETKFLMSIFINFYYPYVALKLKKKIHFLSHINVKINKMKYICKKIQ